MSQNEQPRLINYNTRGWEKFIFSESYLPALSKKFKMGSIDIPSKILASPFGNIGCDGVIFT